MFKLNEMIFIDDTTYTVPYGDLDSHGKRYHNQKLITPSYYKVTGITIGKPVKIQLRKYDVVGDKQYPNPNYSYFVNENDLVK